MNALAAYASRLRTLDRSLDVGRMDFFQKREPEYRELCVSIIRSQAMLMMPEGEDEAEWRHGIELVAQFVASRIFKAASVTGLHLFVSRQRTAAQLPMPAGIPIDRKVMELDHRQISYPTVKQWVIAGRNGAPDGKEFKEFDWHRADDDIAYTVWREIRRGKADQSLDGPRGVLNFIANRTPQRLEPMLTGILEAWREALLARFPDDFKQWVRHTASHVMRAPGGK